MVRFCICFPKKVRKIFWQISREVWRKWGSQCWHSSLGLNTCKRNIAIDWDEESWAKADLEVGVSVKSRYTILDVIRGRIRDNYDMINRVTNASRTHLWHIYCLQSFETVQKYFLSFWCETQTKNCMNKMFNRQWRKHQDWEVMWLCTIGLCCN